MSKKMYIKTYGCQMNVYDSEQMEGLMRKDGFALSDSYEDADLVVLNTCHIREKAAEKVYSELGRIRAEKERMKDAGKRMTIAVAGCVAQAEGAEMKKRAPFVDIVVGPQSYQRLPKLVNNLGQDNVALEFDAEDKFDQLHEEQTEASAASAFVTIQEGCDKFCTFCVVPYTRGAEYSRPVSAIYREAMQKVAHGAKEIVLLGQNVNAYHGEADGNTWNLAELIAHVATISGLERIRYSTSHPRDMDEALIHAHGTIPALMPHLHLPVQSGSDRVLKAMNRKHTAEDYVKVIDALRAARPDLELSSDFIVGFPGETEEDFEDTMRLVERVRYAQAYSFKYSPRPGTPAAGSEDAVPEEVKQVRLEKLQALLGEQQQDYNQQTVGKTLPVLIEKSGRKAGQIVGRTPYMQSVHMVASSALIGSVQQVDITGLTGHGLTGVVI